MTHSPNKLPAGAYEAHGEQRFFATDLTRGPWNPEHQHGGPPVALAVRAIERAAVALGLTHIGRITANLVRPVPLGPLDVEVNEDYIGRNTGHFSARILAAGKEVARFTALAQREAEFELPASIPGHPLPPARLSPEDSRAERFGYVAKGHVGYPDLIESRIAHGDFRHGPAAVWFRLRHPLVAGEAPSPVQRVAVAADSASGVSAVLDFDRYLFINSDLNINLLRRPQGEWICIDAQTLVGPSGSGLTEARLFDVHGLVGRSTQSLSIRPRD